MAFKSGNNNDKPSLPQSYKRPIVFNTSKINENVFGGMNRPNAFPRNNKVLPIGIHSYQLYSCGTPNGQKITIMFEELREIDPSIEYDAWFISLR